MDKNPDDLEDEIVVNEEIYNDLNCDNEVNPLSNKVYKLQWIILLIDHIITGYERSTMKRQFFSVCFSVHRAVHYSSVHCSVTGPLACPVQGVTSSPVLCSVRGVTPGPVTGPVPTLSQVPSGVKSCYRKFFGEKPQNCFQNLSFNHQINYFRNMKKNCKNLIMSLIN